MSGFRLTLDTVSALTRTKSLCMRDLASISLKASPMDKQSSDTTVIISMGAVLDIHLELLEKSQKMEMDGKKETLTG